MKLSDFDIREFQLLYQEEFGIEIEKEQAQEEGANLIKLVSMSLTSFVTKNEHE